jgi:polynucleotide 5'-kinase involved in rRNA processing
MAIKVEEKNKKLNVNLVRHRHKFAPFTRVERKRRRFEVYKLHFEHGMPATKISELMKVDRTHNQQ